MKTCVRKLCLALLFSSFALPQIAGAAPAYTALKNFDPVSPDGSIPESQWSSQEISSTE